EAGMEITFKVGGSFVKLDPSGVTLVGPSVKINSGGSPGKGSGAAPALPGAAAAVDVSEAGKLLVVNQRQALMQKKPLCAICEAAKEGAANA
ncbi:MAG: type VI secretion system tip protein VgrG, partial [Pseudomonas neustonica]